MKVKLLKIRDLTNSAVLRQHVQFNYLPFSILSAPTLQLSNILAIKRGVNP